MLNNPENQDPKIVETLSYGTQVQGVHGAQVLCHCTANTKHMWSDRISIEPLCLYQIASYINYNELSSHGR